MLRPILRFGTGVALLTLIALSAPTPAQEKEPPKKDKGPADAPRFDEDYRQFFKKPETVLEFWKAMQFEIDVGRYDLAAQHLRGLIAKNPSEDELLKLEKEVGMTALLRLRALPPWQDTARKVPRWSDNPKVQQQALDDIEELIKRVTAALKAKLADREQIVKWVKALNASPEEAAYALKELYRYKALAVPPLVDELRLSTGTERATLRSALRRLGPEVVPPLLAALDSNDPDLMMDVLGILVDRNAREVVPHLWYLHASPTLPDRVRRKATDALARFLDLPPSKLPLAPVALTREAERYYQHQVPFADPRAVTVWRWADKGIVAGWPGAEAVPASKAEEYYGLRFAAQALDLDATYRPAQIVHLSLALERALEDAGLSQPLAKIAPKVHELLTTVNPEVVTAVLERALTDQRTLVVLGAVRALGELAEVRAGKQTGRGEPALVRALKYGDKRVQMAAAESLLRLPGPPSALASGLILETLGRNLAGGRQASARPKALVASADDVARERLRLFVNDAGYEPVTVATGREALRRLNAANDVSAILLESTLPDPGLASFLAQLRADVNASRLPVLVVAVPESGESRDLIKRYQAEKGRLDNLAERTRGYRKARQALESKYQAERSQLVKSRGSQPKDLEANLVYLDTRHEEEVRDLAKNSPEASRLDAEARKVEQILQGLAERYAAESRKREESLRRWLEPSPTVSVVSLNFLEDPKKLRYRLQGGDGAELKPLTEAEQKEYAERSVRNLARMARGELAGYDVRPLADGVYDALRGGRLSADGQSAALDVVAKLSGRRSQVELAGVILDVKRDLPLRVKATDELVRHIQQNSLLLTKDLIARLRALFDDAGTQPELRARLAVLQGSLRPDARTTGERLRDYQPPTPAAPKKEP